MQPTVNTEKTTLNVLPVQPAGNITGELGPRCRDCSGAGFTNNISGSSSSCRRCDRTGIEPPSPYEMNERINELEDRIKELIKQVLKLQGGEAN